MNLSDCFRPHLRIIQRPEAPPSTNEGIDVVTLFPAFFDGYADRQRFLSIGDRSRVGSTLRPYDLRRGPDNVPHRQKIDVIVPFAAVLRMLGSS